MRKIAFFVALAVITVVFNTACANKEERAITSGVIQESKSSPAVFVAIAGNARNDESVNPWVEYAGNQENLPPPALGTDAEFMPLSGTAFDSGNDSPPVMTGFPPELAAYFKNTRVDDNINPLAKFVGNQGNFPPPAFSVDIDFTAFNGPDFDEEFSNLTVMNPDGYLGKTIRLIGPYTGQYVDHAGRYYHYVLIDDAIGCCLRYVEIGLSEDITPDRFPENFSIVDVAGEFNTYYDEEIDWDFHYLKVDSLSVLKKGTM